MDRTSILGDTIDYMKELLERINNLQEEETEMNSNKVGLFQNLKDLRPNEVMVRNSPKVRFLVTQCPLYQASLFLSSSLKLLLLNSSK